MYVLGFLAERDHHSSVSMSQFMLALSDNELSFDLESEANTLNIIGAMTFTNNDSNFSKVDDNESP